MMQSSSYYELLDFGNGRKLERFGSVVADRPEILAFITPNYPQKWWKDQTDLRFEESVGNTGVWNGLIKNRNRWVLQIELQNASFKMILKTGNFKHLGIFPEQKEHWRFLMQHINLNQKVLNLFAYTGAASICSALAGGDVFHVDSSKSVVNWAAENAAASGIENIHWVCDDALLFAQKECRRGNQYDFIIMDPPIYGHSKSGRHWKLEQHLPSLVHSVKSLLSTNGHLILNTYSPKMDLDNMKSLCSSIGLTIIKEGWLCVTSLNKRLPLSKYVVAQRT